MPFFFSCSLSLSLSLSVRTIYKKLETGMTRI
jgi:hypothetical protein